MSRRTRRTTAVVMVALLAGGLAACSSTGGRKAVEDAERARNAGKATTPTMTVALVTHSGPGDTFWDIVRKGAQDAAAKDNIKLQYTADPDGPKQANLVQQAIDKKVDGIALTLAKPDAMKAVVGKAHAANIPVVALNGGLDSWKAMGVTAYFGQDEKIAGQQAGERMLKEGAKHPICVIHEQGNVGLEDRCAGVKQKIPATQLLYVNGKAPASMQTAITSKLQQDKAVDYVLTLGGPIALIAVQSKASAASKAKVVTFDTSDQLIAAIKTGTVQWAVDQQPYLQGYLAIDQLWLFKTNGNTVGGGQAVLTGPAFIDKTNVASVEKFAASGRR
ncbi:substrate-binding domain-containing protein [Luteipulveratus mongoliensis]|uniref:Sugar ABC transporter substrate-binding protein n=1 Tax=Luteipulveratus mongoliensis TaxID=571913 RepID=A0A0K1JHF6_9MICO|nr:substrate-binding domain-containing protein [Luteipulveratus mongoliensis]AKU16152.1 sugar ABC transporter substrate-binding protein [Luteipulveratus mongoliensis]